VRACARAGVSATLLKHRCGAFSFWESFKL